MLPGGRADVNGGEAGDVQLKMCQRVFELVAAARNEFLRRIHDDFIGGLDVVAGFFGGMAVDADDAGEDEALGAFAAVAECAFDEGLIESGHGNNLTEIGNYSITISNSRVGRRSGNTSKLKNVTC